MGLESLEPTWLIDCCFAIAFVAYRRNDNDVVERNTTRAVSPIPVEWQAEERRLGVKDGSLHQLV